jgi:hypothetical protein
MDWAPTDRFLAELRGQADGYYTDEATFFGAGGLEQPDAVRQQREEKSSATSIAACHMAECRAPMCASNPARASVSAPLCRL